MKELSIFVDESGDFGAYDHHCPIYLFSLVYHDQQNDIHPALNSFRQNMLLLDSKMDYFHAGPLIRREGEYKDLDIQTRRIAFNKMSYLTLHLPIYYSIVVVEKKHLESIFDLPELLSKCLKDSISRNLEYFLGFDIVKIYYDNGQKQLTNLLNATFQGIINRVDFRNVKPYDYTLFQVADFLSTIELTHYKFKEKTFSASERFFFGDERQFNRNYYRRILSKKLK